MAPPHIFIKQRPPLSGAAYPLMTPPAVTPVISKNRAQ
jgi:hypothetical protein